MHNAESDRDSDGKSVVVPILETKFIAVIPAKLETVCDSIPSISPSGEPTLTPTARPNQSPSRSPSFVPTSKPTTLPTFGDHTRGTCPDNFNRLRSIHDCDQYVWCVEGEFFFGPMSYPRGMKFFLRCKNCISSYGILLIYVLQTIGGIPPSLVEQGH